ncbi:phosphotransferase family protein [Lacticaseibacillus paracasei]|jgi:thiamine kinase-like enzyme|uniref:Thiamine kinase n=1 Tax=Lacticaseibacillus paracasei TaxID=1597 RepID=A0A422M4A5_LACPA|nr:phosphotransferase family protein [Lacticaseibacillus paracasei]OJF75215.1 aminoglycoside phosphotransferase [Lacticaseibacillus casei]AKU34910.1 aminoglycoside phosphotransferase [Lacticaseibacillus paracasei]MBM6412503.1 phosphotransferase family protein [Lacticaseibacillus paracasei]MDM7528302.1 phosphotransferase family protein [Lacticaseibacillus paracasei]MDM7540377.1 phosphotransferase family protein [Lacticaseibacillus paracasei]
MEFELDSGWSLQPAGGSTGSAFLGVYANQKYFLKRNASPFLAALSVEHITPRLLWTRRVSTGDVLTAQEWLDGETLTRQQMMLPVVAKMLAQVHHSSLLKRLLRQVGGQVLDPEKLRIALLQDFPVDVAAQPKIKTALHDLKQWLPHTNVQTVCHGDLNHKNWLQAGGRLYLVDWEQVALGDPAYDLADVLAHYGSPATSHQFLDAYGARLDEDLKRRLYWYGDLHLLHDIKVAATHQRFEEVAQVLHQFECLQASR